MSVKAWVVKDKDKIEQQEFDYPSIEEDAGLLKIEAVGICGSDKHLLNGKGNMPLIAGHEVIGTIEEIGDKAFKSLEAVNNEPLKKGDRVAV